MKRFADESQGEPEPPTSFAPADMAYLDELAQPFGDAYPQ